MYCIFVALIFMINYYVVKGLLMREANFQTKVNTRIIGSLNTARYITSSKLTCAAKCLGTDYCCIASFTKSSNECIVDYSFGCGSGTEAHIGGTLMTKTIDCSARWQAINGRCVQFSTVEKNLEDSKNFCAGIGGRLIIIETTEENAWLLSIVKEGYMCYVSCLATIDVGGIIGGAAVLPATGLTPYGSVRNNVFEECAALCTGNDFTEPRDED